MYYLAQRAHYVDVSVGMWVGIGNTHAQCQGWGWQLREEEASYVHQENHEHLILPASICHVKTMWHCFGAFDNARYKFKDGV